MGKVAQGLKAPVSRGFNSLIGDTYHSQQNGPASESRWMPLKPKYQEQQGYNTGMRVGATPTVATKKY